MLRALCTLHDAAARPTCCVRRVLAMLAHYFARKTLNIMLALCAVMLRDMTKGPEAPIYEVTADLDDLYCHEHFRWE